MSATPDSTLANPEQLIADLQRQLAECKAELAGCNAERDEALAREAATAEVLGVINSSPGELAPVFDAMLEKATRICEGAFGVLGTWDGERFHRVAFQGLPPDLVGLLQQPVTPVPEGIVAPWCSELRPRAASQGRCAAQGNCSLPPGSPPLLRQADHAVAELRGPGRDRN